MRQSEVTYAVKIRLLRVDGAAREPKPLIGGVVVQQLRRLLPRHFTDWRGRYLIEGDPCERWRDCRIVDMSSAGAGLELLMGVDHLAP